MRYSWSGNEWRKRRPRENVPQPIPVSEATKEYLDAVEVLRTLDDEIIRLFLAGTT